MYFCTSIVLSQLYKQRERVPDTLLTITLYGNSINYFVQHTPYKGMFENAFEIISHGRNILYLTYLKSLSYYEKKEITKSKLPSN